MKSLRIVISALLLTVGYLSAQPPADMLVRLRALQLKEAPGPVPLIYSPASEQRALRWQRSLAGSPCLVSNATAPGSAGYARGAGSRDLEEGDHEYPAACDGKARADHVSGAYRGYLSRRAQIHSIRFWAPKP